MKAALYLRVNDATRVRYIERGSASFSYAGRAGPVAVASYYATPVEIIEESAELRN
jgi:TfoX/Sxy family transcriptional regulator of competence genes